MDISQDPRWDTWEPYENLSEYAQGHIRNRFALHLKNYTPSRTVEQIAAVREHLLQTMEVAKDQGAMEESMAFDVNEPHPDTIIEIDDESFEDREWKPGCESKSQRCKEQAKFKNNKRYFKDKAVSLSNSDLYKIFEQTARKVVNCPTTSSNPTPQTPCRSYPSRQNFGKVNDQAGYKSLRIATLDSDDSVQEEDESFESEEQMKPAADDNNYIIKSRNESSLKKSNIIIPSIPNHNSYQSSFYQSKLFALISDDDDDFKEPDDDETIRECSFHSSVDNIETRCDNNNNNMVQTEHLNDGVMGSSQRLSTMSNTRTAPLISQRKSPPANTMQPFTTIGHQQAPAVVSPQVLKRKRVNVDPEAEEIEILLKNSIQMLLDSTP